MERGAGAWRWEAGDGIVGGEEGEGRRRVQEDMEGGRGWEVVVEAADGGGGRWEDADTSSGRT